jgi:diguanylate cyclase (GGDEF)-like protein
MFERNDLVDVEHFPCGWMVTTGDIKILFANQYFREHLNMDPSSMIGQGLEVMFSRASQLFCNSYVIPMTLQQGRCCEIQLTLLNVDGEQVPLVASVKCAPNGTLTWIFMEADNRNKLFHELESARFALEEQREQLQQIARTDPLTGLANRRELDDVLDRTFRESERSGLAVSILLIDIDKFKSINDTHGHDCGDQVICHFAKTLRSLCRSTDTIARLGGDEFVCVLPDTELSEAQVLADRIQRSVLKSENKPCSYTVSIGLLDR